MFALNSGDKIRGDASVASKVDHLIHGVVGLVYTQLANGQLSDSIGDLYTAAAAVGVASLTLVNTHTSAITVNIYLTPSGGTARRMIPKDLSLQPGYSLTFDGQKFGVYDTNGGLVLGASVSDLVYSAGWDGVTTVAPSKNTVYDIIQDHKTLHQDGGSGEISVTGLSGLLSDDQHVLDAEVLAYLQTLPKFSAHKNGTNQTGIVTSTWTKVTFTTEEYDVGSAYDAANSKWIPGIIGKAHFDAIILWTVSVDQAQFMSAIYKNGVVYKGTIVRQSGTSNVSNVISLDALVDVVTDYFEIYVYQSTGGDRIIDGAPANTCFGGHVLP